MIWKTLNMDFLSKTFLSLTTGSIPYTIGEQIWQNEIWKLYDGVNPKDNSPVSIFEFNGTTNPNGSYQLMASNCFKFTKLVKFPEVISAVDFIERSKDNMFIVTERVKPLSAVLQTCSKDYKIFGINSVIKALTFLNETCKYVHSNVYIDAIFVNRESNWKLFGFELMSGINSPLTMNRFAPIVNKIELLSELMNGDVSLDVQIDSYLLGKFIEEFIPEFPKNNLKKLTCRFGSRLTVEEFEVRHTTLFESNTLIQLNNELNDMKFMNNSDKLSFIKYNLSNYLTEDLDLPDTFVSYKILPELVAQFTQLSQFKPTVNTTPEEMMANKEILSILLNFILKFSGSLGNQEYSTKIFPIIKMSFANNDRAVRMVLLNNLQTLKEKLSSSDVQAIFPSLITGIQDSNFVIRELTLTAINSVIDCLTDKIINQDLLKILAKCQNDPKPSIRTNTIIIITKIASKIYKNSRNNVLITALNKSLKDSFTPCKMAALQGFRALVNEFSIEEICNKVLGILATSLMDPKSKKVRSEAKELFQTYFDLVEDKAKNLGEEEDEELEEKQFLSKYGTTETKEQAQTEKSFGWGFVNKIVSNVEGNLNEEVNKSSSTVNLISNTKPSVSPSPVVSNNQSVEDFTIDDGWGNEADNWDNEESPVKQAPKPTRQVSKPVVRPSKPTAKSSLKLGHKEKKAPTKLNLNLVDDGEDGWGQTDDW